MGGAATKKPAKLAGFLSHSPVLPAAIAAAAEAEGDAGAAAVIARTVAAIVTGTVIAVPARRIVVVAAVVRPVVTVAPVVMAMPPMPMAVLRADIRRGSRGDPGLRGIRRRFRLHRVVGGVGRRTSHQSGGTNGKHDN